MLKLEKVGNFQKTFEEELNKQSDIDNFGEELKHVQKMIIRGKLNPANKTILIEWMELYPNRFKNFCNVLSEENRQKLNNFLKL